MAERPASSARNDDPHGYITVLNENDVLLGRGLGPAKFIGM